MSSGTHARRPFGGALLAAIAGLLLYLPGLGAIDFLGDDEVLDAGIIRDVVEEGNWLFPEFNGEMIPKPPLFYWASASLATLAGGFDERTARLPSALLAAATVAATVIGGASLVGSRAAVLAGFLLAVMPVFYAQARIGRADMTMTFLVTAVLLLFLQRTGDLAGWRRLSFFVLLGLAGLAKGAAGIGLVLVVLIGEVIFGAGLAAVRPLAHPSALLAVAIPAGWYVLGALHWGEPFVSRHLLAENLQHFLGGSRLVGDAASRRPWTHHLTHLRNVFTGTAPWGLLLPVAIRDMARLPDGERREALMRLARWVGLGLLYFTLAARKSPYYLLPLFPPVALLAAFWILERTSGLEVGWRSLRNRAELAGAAGALGAVLIGVAAARAAGIADAEIAAISTAAREQFLVPLAGIAILLVASGAFFSMARAEWRTIVPRLWLVMFLSLGLAQRIEPALVRDLSMRGFAETVAAEAGESPDLYVYAKPSRTVVYYAERDIPILPPGREPPRPFWLVVRESLWEGLPEEWRRAARIVATAEGRVVTRARMKVLLVEIGARPARDRPAPRSPSRGEEVQSADQVGPFRVSLCSSIQAIRCPTA